MRTRILCAIGALSLVALHPATLDREPVSIDRFAWAPAVPREQTEARVTSIVELARSAEEACGS